MTVSIHARVERATAAERDKLLQDEGFNPRTRRACDIASFLEFFNPFVSIHARVERATWA